MRLQVASNFYSMVLLTALLMLCAFLPLQVAVAQCQNGGFPDYVPAAGCSCKPSWSYGGKNYCNSECAAPDGDDQPWCYTSTSCNGKNWSYCSTNAVKCETSGVFVGYIPNECECQDTWTYNNKQFCNGQCANPDSDPNGPWCYTKPGCAKSYSYCNAPLEQPRCETSASNPYAHTHEAPDACSCKQSWSAGGKLYCNGECALPDNDPNGPWCVTDGTCAGKNFTYCDLIASPTPTPTPTPVSSLDAQCARAWRGYSGNWVAEAKNGLTADCGNEDCGVLKCTNTQWNNYCYVYTCPAGSTCTINGRQIVGPATVDICSCIEPVDALRPIYVADGTACSGDASKVCSNHECVDRTGAPTPTPIAEPGRSVPDAGVIDIRGAILQDDGAPLSRVLVHASVEGRAVFTGRSDADGKYQISDIPVGATYRIKIASTDYRIAPETFSGTASNSLVLFSQATPINKPAECTAKNLGNALISASLASTQLRRVGTQLIERLLEKNRNKSKPAKKLSSVPDNLERDVERYYVLILDAADELPQVIYACPGTQICPKTNVGDALKKYKEAVKRLAAVVKKAAKRVGDKKAEKAAKALKNQILDMLDDYPKKPNICE